MRKHKIKILIIIFTFFSVNIALTQNYSSALGVSGGYSQDGYGFLLNYNYYTERDAFIQAGLFMSFSENEVKGISIPYNIFTFNAGFLKTIYSTRRNSFKVHIGGGFLGGYEAINEGSDRLENGGLVLDKSKFIYGAFASLEADIYLDNEWSIILKINQYYHHNSDLGNLTPYAGIGLRYFLF